MSAGERILNEPVLIVGLVQSVLALVLTLGFDITEAQVGAILAVTSAILALIARAFAIGPKSQV